MKISYFIKVHKFACLFLLIIHTSALDTAQQQKKVREYAKETIEQIKLQVHNTLEKVRFRRSFSFLDDESSKVPSVAVNKINSDNSIPSVVAWCVIHINGEEIAFAGTKEGEIARFDENFNLLFIISDVETIDSILGFVHRNVLWLIVYHAQDGHFLRVYNYYNETLNGQQCIIMPGETTPTIVKLKDKIYLFSVSNEDFNSVLNLYEWRKTQFDLMTTLPLNGNYKSLAAWEMNSDIFIALNMDQDNKLNIFRFTESDGKLVHVQYMEGSFNVIKYFEVAGSSYLICGGEKEIVLYWWNVNQFLKYQEIHNDSEPVVDISTFNLYEDLIVIVLTKISHVEYYFQDPSSYIKAHGTEHFGNRKLKSTTIWKNKEVFYLLPVFEDYDSVPILQLDMNSPSLSPVLEPNAVQNCLQQVTKVLGDISDEIDESNLKLRNIWTKDKISRIPTIFVNGSVISSKTVKISHVSFTDDSELHNAQIISDFVNQFNRKVKNLLVLLRNAVMKSRKQEINGDIEFVYGIEASIINVTELISNFDLNGIYTSELSSSLKIKGFQVIPYELTFKGMNATHVETTFLNKNKINDYLLLTKNWLMDGVIIFKDLSISNMTVKSESLNDMSLRNMVIASSSQNITSKKVFNSLSANVITSKDNVKGVNISRLKKFVSKESPVFEVQLNFSSISFENVNLHSINGLNFSQLVSDSVKYSENENIIGKKIFLGPVILKNELFVSGHVNSMELNNLMTLHKQQIFYKNIEFLNVSFKDIKTHSLNGIDLCKEAILKSGNFKLNNSVYFLQPLEVFHIKMKNDVSINSIDLSEEMSHIVTSKEPIFNSSFTIGNIIVLNDVKINDSGISTLLSNLLNDVWYITKSQNVSEGNFNTLNVDYLEVDDVNGIHLDDIVLSEDYSIIDTVKILEDVEVESLSMQDRKMLNNVDFTSDFVISLVTEKLNTFKVENMSIKGNLNVSALNNLDILDLMQVKKLQECYGHKNFAKLFLKNLTATTLNFSNIYNKSFIEYVSNAVHHSSNKSIINKKFSYISGKGLINEGFLNGRKFEKLLGSVVTLKTNQNISCSLKFSAPLKMKTLSVKNFDLINLNDIIFTDKDAKNISNKEFNKIFANKAEVDSANNVNVSNLKNVFFKGQDNRITEEITFLSDLKVSKLKIQSPAIIDGVNLNDSFQVNGEIYATALDFSVIYAENIEVDGKINGCDLSDIDDLLMKNVSVKSEKYFTNMNIDGNLHIKNTLNGLPEVSLSDFVSRLDTSDDIIAQHNFLDIKATHLQVLNNINGVIIDFLLKDAVTQHKFQNIEGIKVFQQKLSANNASINLLNVTTLNKVNFPLLYRKHLSKKKDQMLSLSFINVTAKDIYVDGAINGIKLPHDVILTHTKDKINFPVIIKEAIKVPDIHITGMIDGVHLSQFLDNKVSLMNSENVSSTLTFLKDFSVKGNLEIINSVNGINFSEVVNTMKHAQPIEGNKIFLKELFLHSNLKVLGFIDDFSLDDISENLNQNNMLELFEDKVEFPEIEVLSLNVTSINNISVQALWELIHVVEKNIHDELDNLTDMINAMDDKLQILKGSISPLSLYAFFELHQILDLGYTLKFLPVYEPGIFGEKYQLPTAEMVAWLDQNETCRNFKSLMMDVQSNGSLKESKKVPGRVFPFTLRRLQEKIRGFTLHVDRSKRCTAENQKPDILKMLFVDRNESRHTLVSPPGSVMHDAKVLEMENDFFLVVVYETKVNDEEKIYLHKYDLINDTWIEVQKFHTSAISSVDMIYIDDLDDLEAYLVVTGTNDTSGIDIYSWDFEMDAFNLDLHISKSVSSSALWVNTEKDVFLLLAKENTKIFKNNVWVTVYTEPVEIYLLKDDLKLKHEINIHGISSFETFNLSGKNFS
ncbi:uncharacterized protein NPIL_622341 [Nephila pilipes]|uniref:Uncharacterized protein n=1 Tax=Nephila pilipes TaxID=299642 RepID=A0A8X6QL89_NEPPI|nr:uncharacterized protein NPIL_622341 [Nephila pilipes]